MLAALVGIVGTAVCVGYFIDTANARLRPGSYREAVERVLDEQHIDYRDVEVIDGCAPSYQLCRFYAGKVRIMAATSDDRPQTTDHYAFISSVVGRRSSVVSPIYIARTPSSNDRRPPSALSSQSGVTHV